MSHENENGLKVKHTSKAKDEEGNAVGFYGYSDFCLSDLQKGEPKKKVPCPLLLLKPQEELPKGDVDCQNFFNSEGYLTRHLGSKKQAPLPEAWGTYYGVTAE